MKKNPLSFQLDLNPDDFLPASEEERVRSSCGKALVSGKTVSAD